MDGFWFSKDYDPDALKPARFELQLPLCEFNYLSYFKQS